MGKERKARQGDHSHCKGSLYIIGIGPGGLEHLTIKARDCLESCDVVVGYSTYIELIKPLLSKKEVVSTGMTQEVKRCKKAIEIASQGKRVALVSSGDAGIYGMAGLVFEMLRVQNKEDRIETTNKKNLSSDFCLLFSEIAIEVIPGVPALAAAASLLGAPLMHDFVSISLSDLLTSWDTILRRLEAASAADFVIVLYNPKSMKRRDQIREAVEVIRRYRASDTPVGIVKAATRNGERAIIINLDELPEHFEVIDMTTILIIGNSTTFIYEGRMVTPRGYRINR